MCIGSRTYAAPPAPPPATLPPAPAISKVAAPSQMQAAPATPMSGIAQDTLIKRRGKRGMVIQLGSTAGTNIPGE